MNERVLIYGAGGHAKVIADILESEKKMVLGFVDDDPVKWGKSSFGYQIAGYSAFLETIGDVDYRVIVAIGDNRLRERVVEELASTRNARFDTAVHASAVIGRDTNLGQGTVVMAGAVINCGSTIGRHVIVNTGTCIDHDCNIGDFVHLSPGAHLGGGVTVGAGSWIGLGASIINNCRIGKNVIVGMGAVVVRDIPDSWVVAGNPARFLRMTEERG